MSVNLSVGQNGLSVLMSSVNNHRTNILDYFESGKTYNIIVKLKKHCFG